MTVVRESRLTFLAHFRADSMTSTVGTKSYAKQLFSPRWSSNRSLHDWKKRAYRALNCSKVSVSWECDPGPEAWRRATKHQQGGTNHARGVLGR